MQEAYTVPGWPTSVLGHSAVTPNFNRVAGGGAQQYKDGVTGQPGTLPIPVSGPGVENARMALMASGTGRSTDAPSFFLPNLYYARPQAQFWPGAGQPVSVNSDNMMPVPAVDPRGIPARLSQVAARPLNRNLAARANPVTWPVWNAT